MAFSIGQSPSNTFTTATTVTVTTAKPTAGQLLLLTIYLDELIGGTVPSFALPTDNSSGGGTWVVHPSTSGGIEVGSASGFFAVTFYKVTNANDHANLTSVVCTWNGISTGGAYIDEFDGFTGTPTIDLAAAISTPTTTTVSTLSATQSATGAAATELVYSFMGQASPGGTITAKTFSPDGGTTTFTFTNSALTGRANRGWATATSSGSSAQWKWTWTTAEQALVIGATFYDASSSTPISGADSGSGAGSATVVTQIAVADSGSGVEGSPLTIALTPPDSGSGSDSQALAPHLTGTDIGAGLDASTFSAALVAVELGAGSDSAAAAVGIASSDSGSGLGAGSVAAAVGIADWGSGAEGSPGAGSMFAGASLATRIPFVPGYLASPSGVTIAAGLSDADSGSGVDSASVAVASLSADSGSGFDASPLTSAVSSSDLGAGLDVSSAALGITSVDSGSGSDASSATAVVSTSESGSGLDLSTLRVSVTAVDSGLGSDLAAVAASLGLSDIGSGSDAFALSGFVPQGDSGSGLDQVVSVLAAVLASELGHGTEVTLIAATLATSETGLGSDAAVMTLALFSADSGSGIDAQTFAVMTEMPGVATLGVGPSSHAILTARPTARATLGLSAAAVATLNVESGDMSEVAGTMQRITVTFSEVNSDGSLTPADPTSGTVVLEPVAGSAIDIALSEFTHVSTGVYTYEWDTTNAAGQYTAQVQGVGALLATSEPLYFTIDAPAVSGLT